MVFILQRYRGRDWIIKYVLPTRNSPPLQRWARLKMERWKITFQANGFWRQEEVTMLISDKHTWNQSQAEETNKVNLYSSRETQQEDITMSPIHINAPMWEHPILSNTTRQKGSHRLQQFKLGDFRAHLSPGGRSSRRTINKGMSELSHTIGQVDFTDVYRIFHATALG